MYLTTVGAIFNHPDKYADHVCERCEKSPAVKMIADCDGDALTLCREHWMEYLEKEILPMFDQPLGSALTPCEGETEQGWKYQYTYDKEVAMKEFEKRQAKYREEV